MSRPDYVRSSSRTSKSATTRRPRSALTCERWRRSPSIVPSLPDQLGPKQIHRYQLYLVRERKLAPTTFAQIVSGLRFFDETTLGRKWVSERIPHPRRERRLPTVLSRVAVAALLDAPRNLKHRVMLMALYGAGLRVAELVALQAADVDSKRQLIRVRQGKGRQDREVLLPARLLESLRAYWKAFQPIVWLFPGQDPQRPISTRSVRLVCRQAAKKAKLAKRVEPLRPRLTHPTTFKPLSVGPAASFIGLYRKRPAIQGQHALPGNTARRALPIQHSPIPAVIGLSPYHYSGNA